VLARLQLARGDQVGGPARMFDVAHRPSVADPQLPRPNVLNPLPKRPNVPGVVDPGEGSFASY
jgi:hypothetical protein